MSYWKYKTPESLTDLAALTAKMLKREARRGGEIEEAKEPDRQA